MDDCTVVYIPEWVMPYIILRKDEIERSRTLAEKFTIIASVIEDSIVNLFADLVSSVEKILSDYIEPLEEIYLKNRQRKSSLWWKFRRDKRKNELQRNKFLIKYLKHLRTKPRRKPKQHRRPAETPATRLADDTMQV